VNRHNCNKNPKRIIERAGAYCDLYSGCDDNAQVVTESGGHSCPGATVSTSTHLGTKPSTAISAIDEIWDFFKNQPTQ
jgi:polyhydroxybutyrate depolymerase